MREVTEIKGTSDIGVSVDGTWQKRGVASLNGVVGAISTTNFKVLDVEMMSRNCKACVAIGGADKSPADKSPADKSPTDKSPAEKSPTDKSPNG